MQFGAIDQFENKTHKNIGDYVQTLAALQFSDQEPIMIPRESMHLYEGEDVKLIMASWLIENVQSWPPSDKINPLFISTHLTSELLAHIINKRGTDYLRKYAPIGCRDSHTRDILLANGIDAYFSGCLTLTLGESYKRDCVGDEVLFVDPMYNYKTKKEFFLEILKQPRVVGGRFKRGGFLSFKKALAQIGKRDFWLNKIFGENLVNEAIFISQICDLSNVSNHLDFTRSYLKRLSRAKLVVTSRIHCALPCLAIGTPVIFIDSELDQHRISGLKDLFLTITIDSQGRISSNFDMPSDFLDIKSNKLDHLSMAIEMKNRCVKFMRG